MLVKDMVFGKVMVNRKDELAFVIKEDIFNGLTIGETPGLESRTIIFEGDNKEGFALLVLFRLNKNDDFIYGTWFNNIEKKHIYMLEYLIAQDELLISIIDEYNVPINTFKAENQLKFIFNNYIKSTKFNNIYEWRNFIKRVKLSRENKVTLFEESKFYCM